jgi:nucleotide-binding universal stress UspA family protein
MIRKVLVATDGSEHAKKVIEVGADIASKHDAAVYVVHAVPEAMIEKETMKFMEAEHIAGKPGSVYSQQIGGRIFNEAKRDIFARGVLRAAVAVRVGNPAQEIIKFAKEHDIDMVIVGCNGVRGKELYSSRVARKVSRLVECDCVTVTL